MLYLRISFLCLLTFSLSHCLSYDLSRRIVQQGNLLPAAKVNRLKLGMSKQEVIQLMGNSLITSPFHPNRIDYAYSWQKGSRPMTIKYVALTFKQDRLVKIEHYP